MRIDTNITIETSKVIVSHNGQSIDFSVSTFSRTPFSKFDIFEQINLYWSTLPESKQQEIFNVYGKIYNDFTDIVVSNQSLLNILSSTVSELMDLHDLDHIKRWLQVSYNIIIPSNFNDEYKESIETNSSRDKTYTRSDYVDLMALSVLMRTMIPIWGEYIYLTGKEFGTGYKTFQAFKLLFKSKIMDSPIMEKLSTYVKITSNKDNNKQYAILDGVSSQDFDIMMLGLVVVRRLCIADIKNVGVNANPITFIYMYVTSKIKSDNDGSMIKGKKPGASDYGSDEKVSSIDMYRIKADTSPGDIALLEASVEDSVSIAMRLCSSIDIEFLEKSIESSSVLLDNIVTKPQVTLLKWIMNPVISSSGVDYLSKNTLVRLLGIMEAVLWHRGYNYLAVLGTSYQLMGDVMSISLVDKISRLNVNLVEELNKQFPYTKVKPSRKSAPVEENYCIKSIESLASDFISGNWKPTARSELMELIEMNNSKVLPIKSDIKNDLGRLALELGRRDWI